MLSFLAGLGLGFSLIVAIGAQNLFVLRQGLRRDRVLLTAAICALSDALLIVLGVTGVGLLVRALPWLFDAVRWVGAVFLVGYGALAARRALRGQDATLSAAVEPAGRGVDHPHQWTGSGKASDPRGEKAGVATAPVTRAAPVVLTVLALTWLNPHVYLDTVFLLGTVANSHGEARWAFAAGAATASVLWFFGLALGARLLAGVLTTERAWRVFDALVATVMIALGVSLAVGH